MRQLILVIVMLLGAAFGASAWTEEEMMHCPDTLQQRDCEMVKDPKAPCNQGAEPFSEFLVRFCTDKDFRLSRLHPDMFGAANIDVAEWIKEVMSEGKFDFAPVSKTENDVVTLATWYGVGADQALYMENVYYDGEEVDDPENDPNDVDGACFWIFERRDGKWYLTHWHVVG